MKLLQFISQYIAPIGIFASIYKVMDIYNQKKTRAYKEHAIFEIKKIAWSRDGVTINLKNIGGHAYSLYGVFMHGAIDEPKNLKAFYYKMYRKAKAGSTIRLPFGFLYKYRHDACTAMNKLVLQYKDASGKRYESEISFPEFQLGFADGPSYVKEIETYTDYSHLVPSEDRESVTLALLAKNN